MRLVPEDNTGKIVFFATRVATWAERAEQIGASPELIAELAAQTEAVREALDVQYRLQQETQNATRKLNDTLETMARTGASVIKQIRTRADRAGNEVYQLAMIPGPEAGSPIGEPGRPYNFSFTVQQVGSLSLRWKCRNLRGAVGTMYQVRRKIGPDGVFEPLGVVGEKKFEDITLPKGASEIVYQVQAIRSTRTGPLAEFTVRVGTDEATRKFLASAHGVNRSGKFARSAA